MLDGTSNVEVVIRMERVPPFCCIEFSEAAVSS
jgi:hypothetical protein